MPIMEWYEVDPFREGIDDCETFILAGKCFALALVVDCIAGSGTVMGACFEHAVGLTSACFF